MKGRAIAYSAEELAWIEERKTWPRDALHLAFTVLFDRRDVSLPTLNALCKRRGWFTGRNGCFVKGQEPPNKGKTMPEGVGGRHPNARRTQFKRGERSGVAVKLYQPVGTEKVRDGYLVRKVNDDLPLQARWRAVHLIEWEALNGSVPEGHCLKCLDGDRMNTAPSNWQCVPRGVLARLNGGRHRRRVPYDAAHPDLKPTVMALAQVEHAAHTRRKDAA